MEGQIGLEEHYRLLVLSLAPNFGWWLSWGYRQEKDKGGMWIDTRGADRQKPEYEGHVNNFTVYSVDHRESNLLNILGWG